jgi:hypothetical protein
MSHVHRKAGPSGEPVLHFIMCPSRSQAEEQAKRASNNHQSPIHHSAHGPGQNPHYHPVDAQGEIKKNGAHYGYSS